MKPFALVAWLLLSVTLQPAVAVDVINGSGAVRVVQFKDAAERRTDYRISIGNSLLHLLSTGPVDWVDAVPAQGSTRRWQLGNRVVLRLQPGASLENTLQDSRLVLARTLPENLFILQAWDAWEAIDECERLCSKQGVLTCHPVRRSPAGKASPYASKPNDPRFQKQWHLEQRSSSGVRTGVDLNVRAAWPISKGEGVVVAIGDDGVDLNHPDLTNNAESSLHFNFTSGKADGSHPSLAQDHGTPVAGIVAATANNEIGVSGVAPSARFASWVIFNQFDALPDEEGMMDMFQYMSNSVAIQNHSWGNSADVTAEFLTVSDLETTAISNAVTLGRGGKGVVIVRAAGNDRGKNGDANFDAYARNPNVITVGAVRVDGRVAKYSNPGTCILVSAPSAESNDRGTVIDLAYPTICTTDRLGSAGRNTFLNGTDDPNYGYDATGFTGTSASTPEIAGIVALMLAANPALTIRDVQLILAMSSKIDLSKDRSAQTNFAGLVFSRQSGFGVPDAFDAVSLAKSWQLRPALTTVTQTNALSQDLKDDGLVLKVSGLSLSDSIRTIPSFPSLGLQPDEPMPAMQVVDVGVANTEVTNNLAGKAALIKRGVNLFSEKIEAAAKAGASLAIIYNDTGSDTRIMMQGTEFVSIPAVFISQNAGSALVAQIQADPLTTVQLAPQSARFTFAITNQLSCEHVALQVDGVHSSFSQMRIVLVSPTGTRSVMQAMANTDPISFDGWMYYSVAHFLEPATGQWTAYVTDEAPGRTGTVTSVSLTLRGVPIIDTDADGLDDNWEVLHFGSLANGPKDDPDADGLSNIREMLTGQDPVRDQRSFTVDLSPINENFMRVSWFGKPNKIYEVLGNSSPERQLSNLFTVQGNGTEMEQPVEIGNFQRRFFQLKLGGTTP